MSTTHQNLGFIPTIFLYTEEQRGRQVVESRVIGSFSDISNSEKYVVVKDPNSGIQFVYAMQHSTNNLDAVAITEIAPIKFDGKNGTVINDVKYRLGTPENAMKFLRNKSRWIQDKGCVLSVLLQNAAARRNAFIIRTIERQRITDIPPDAPVELLPPEEPVPTSEASSSSMGETPPSQT
jgi:hypothetical protein